MQMGVHGSGVECHEVGQGGVRTFVDIRRFYELLYGTSNVI